MYFLVLYNLSPIQQGIQVGHCAVEYVSKYWYQLRTRMWIGKDKTFIVLNGWTSIGLNKHIQYLKKQKIDIATFKEPDLWGITTCVCFMATDWDDITKYFTPLFRLA